MNEHRDDPVERWLASEPCAAAPPALAARVMDAVRRSARRPAPLPFPWPRFAVGVAAAVLVCVLGCVLAHDLGTTLRWR